eukprot:1161170-Pelagomonas_calceolata.AAC.4
MDLFSAGRDQPQTDQPNDLAEGHCNGTSLVLINKDIRCEHGRSAQEAIRMGCKSPRSALKE